VHHGMDGCSSAAPPGAVSCVMPRGRMEIRCGGCALLRAWRANSSPEFSHCAVQPFASSLGQVFHHFVGLPASLILVTTGAALAA
jgi:hypothetical protein